MAGETKAIAQFAATLRYDDIPAPVIAMTKACVIDAVAVALFGSSLPWSTSVADFARHVGGGGSSTILSPQMQRAGAPAAALANGTFAHAFEFDNLRQPSVGVHPGADRHRGRAGGGGGIRRFGPRIPHCAGGWQRVHAAHRPCRQADQRADGL